MHSCISGGRMESGGMEIWQVGLGHVSERFQAFCFWEPKTAGAAAAAPGVIYASFQHSVRTDPLEYQA